ncbi:signal transduction histidine kinase [Rhodococcus sp. 27YEA15]
MHYRPSVREASGVDTHPDAPLWRAAQAFRLVTLGYAVSYQFASASEYTHLRLSWSLVALMAIWSGASAIMLAGGKVPRYRIVLADQVIVIALMASTRLVADPDWYHDHQTLPTTLWATNAVISAAVLGGPWIGMASGVLISTASVVVRDQLNLDLWRDATAPVLVSVGLALGLATTTARRAHRQLEQAVRLAAATEERERLAREVHDGVLQVLAMVRRRGTALGGEAALLAELAGEQEVALRTLISEQVSGSTSDVGGQTVDLCPLLTTQASTTVSVSTPAHPVVLERDRAIELAAIVDNALSNVELHAGPGAKAYVLLEDLPGEVVVSIRDDGVGIAAGRLDQARNEGRMGVSKSILGRAEVLGGTADLHTGPGEGTEWEITVPKGKSSD